MLKRFAEIIKTEKLDDRVILVGSFCMERCGESMSWRFHDEDISSKSLEEAEKALRSRLAERGNRD